MLFSCHDVYKVLNAAAWTNAGIVWTRGMDKLRLGPDREKWSINCKKKQFIGADQNKIEREQNNILYHSETERISTCMSQFPRLRL